MMKYDNYYKYYSPPGPFFSEDACGLYTTTSEHTHTQTRSHTHTHTHGHTHTHTHTAAG